MTMESGKFEIYVGPDFFPAQELQWPDDVLVVTEGQDTSRCVASIRPRLGTGEEMRMREGGWSRREIVIVLYQIASDTVQLPVELGRFYVMPQSIPPNIRPHPTTDLTQTDRDLAIRLSQQERIAWRQLGAQPWDGPNDLFKPLDALLVDDLGKTLAAVWAPSDQLMRWYFLPPGCKWEPVIDWLVSRAIPTYIPQAVYRARPSEAVTKEFMTDAERQLAKEITDFEQGVEGRRAKLMADSAAASKEASDIRNPLLFGRGHDLKHAVDSILRDSGFETEDLDESLGEGMSADLLAKLGDRYWLVEVTSSTGTVKEAEWTNLGGHLKIWPTLRQERLEGGVLIINNNLRLPPAERPRPYTREVFLSALDCPVISTTKIVKWWRDDNLEALRAAVTGPPRQHA